ncbi:MAG: hypothetical protein DRJ10_05120 [Bacteroidetes bacterium]|nr:MAG: hypothetical protein DRJ10_05120 [Bacteroidota bacterium]RLD83814.1 MAG: hypothetical protein DRJ07_05965 [Bacteroidota bacterium]
MPSVNVVVDHSLNRDDAKERIKKLFDKLKEDFQDKISDVNEIWNENHSDFSFKIMGLLMKGRLSVSSSDVRLDGQIPFTALPFKKLIENTIRKEAINLLSE